MKELLRLYGRQSDIVASSKAVERNELIQITMDFVQYCRSSENNNNTNAESSSFLKTIIPYKYDLIANITHESPTNVGKEGIVDPLQEGIYKCHVQHRGTKQWYEIQDLHVTEVMPQQIGISESYVLIFERQQQLQQPK